MSWEGIKYVVKKYIFTDTDADDLTVNERSDDDEQKEIGSAPTANFSVWYRKSLTVGVKKGKTIPLLWCVSWTNRVDSRQTTSKFLNPVSINLKKLPQMPVSVFLNHSERNWPNPGCSFYLSVSMSRIDTVTPTPFHFLSLTFAFSVIINKKPPNLRVR